MPLEQSSFIKHIEYHLFRKEEEEEEALQMQTHEKDDKLKCIPAHRGIQCKVDLLHSPVL